jgi:hypothetical protein
LALTVFAENCPTFSVAFSTKYYIMKLMIGNQAFPFFHCQNKWVDPKQEEKNCIIKGTFDGEMLCFLLKFICCIRMHKTRELALTVLAENCRTFSVASSTLYYIMKLMMGNQAFPFFIVRTNG